MSPEAEGRVFLPHLPQKSKTQRAQAPERSIQQIRKFHTHCQERCLEQAKKTGQKTEGPGSPGLN